MSCVLSERSCEAKPEAAGEEGRKEHTMGKDLAGAIDVMAYGYNVAVLINGVDVGIRGGKSESKRLFGTDHSMMSKLPEDMKNLACLKAGANEIQVDYQGLKDVDSTGMTIELRSAEQFGTDECRFHFREEPDEKYDRIIRYVVRANCRTAITRTLAPGLSASRR